MNVSSAEVEIPALNLYSLYGGPAFLSSRAEEGGRKFSKSLETDWFPFQPPQRRANSRSAHCSGELGDEAQFDFSSATPTGPEHRETTDNGAVETHTLGCVEEEEGRHGDPKQAG